LSFRGNSGKGEIKAAKEKLECEEENKTKIVEKDKAAAEDMRKQALERMGQTVKRKKAGGNSEVPSKKSRRSTADAIEYLKERADKESVLKEQELDQRKKEQENMVKQQQEQQQQQILMMLFNQQQQQSQALLAFMQKFVPK